MSKDTYMRVENGLNVRDTTYSAVGTALGWSPGACISTLEDASPAEIAASTIRAIKDSVISDLRRRGLL
ncbi:hypothetical protein ACFZC7_03510 [Streptomyces massasporeus]